MLTYTENILSSSDGLTVLLMEWLNNSCRNARSSSAVLLYFMYLGRAFSSIQIVMLPVAEERAHTGRGHCVMQRYRSNPYVTK